MEIEATVSFFSLNPFLTFFSRTGAQ